MIDFRYHLVSLISVFLALAIGIVLGAGPLRETIGESLTGQVDKLRADRNQLSSELSQSRQDLANQDTYVQVLATSALREKLKEQKIALVTTGKTNAQDVTLVSQMIEAAGGKVVSTATIGSNWLTSNKAKYREALAGQVVQYLPQGSAATTGEETLAHALGSLLQNPDNASLAGILNTKQTPLLDKLELGPRADAILVVGQPTVLTNTSAKKEDGEAGEYGRSQLNTIVSGLAASGVPTTVWAAAVQKTDLAASLRSQQLPLSTVDGLGTSSGAVSAALAIANTISGKTGNWGFGIDATQALPPLVAAVQPAPQPDPQPTAPEQPPAPQNEQGNNQ